MSFRLFIYLCALIGGWAAFVGWGLGLFLFQKTQGDSAYLRTMILGFFLGLIVAFGLGLLDAVWNLSLSKFGAILGRLTVACTVGSLGGLVGGAVGQFLYELLGAVGFVAGWTITGFIVGFSVAGFEMLSGLFGNNLSGAIKKAIKTTLGGTLGGIIGGCLAYGLMVGFVSVLKGNPNLLWSPTAAGFVAIGLLIGLLVALAQIILKEAWVRVEAGFRPGREMILAKEKTSVGRAEGTDIPLFGDNGVEKLHGRIVNEKGRFFLVLDESVPDGTTFVNDHRVSTKSPLKSGDLIKMGNKSLLRFYEKTKR